MTAGSTPAAPAINGVVQIRSLDMNKIVKFVNEVKSELKKVSWSTRRELMNSTIVVIVSVVILAVFIGICDLIWSNSINFIMR